MELIETSIPGCFEIRANKISDKRGHFLKLFHKNTFAKLGLNVTFEESYCSTSSKGVLRGLHFQTPPKAHVKLVSCLEGEILDVVVDLRKKSPTYRQHFKIYLSSEKGNLLYVPEGLAHGFYVVSEKAIFLSLNSKAFSAEYDKGIHWKSVGMNWIDDDPIISEKDENQVSLDDFDSPF